MKLPVCYRGWPNGISQVDANIPYRLGVIGSSSSFEKRKELVESNRLGYCRSYSCPYHGVILFFKPADGHARREDIESEENRALNIRLYSEFYNGDLEGTDVKEWFRKLKKDNDGKRWELCLHTKSKAVVKIPGHSLKTAAGESKYISVCYRLYSINGESKVLKEIDGRVSREKMRELVS